MTSTLKPNLGIIKKYGTWDLLGKTRTIVNMTHQQNQKTKQRGKDVRLQIRYKIR